jgi:hypothetical protein
VADDVYGFDRARAERLKAIADHPRVINSLRPPRKRQPTGGGEQLAFYKAAEDLAPTRSWFYANPCDRNGNITDDTDFTMVYKWGTSLTNMRAGYLMLTTVVDGDRVPIPIDCVPTSCANSGASVTADSAPAGEVGTSYTYTFTTAGLSSAATATGLPDGLTLSGTTISGTPTTAGSFYVKITGPKTVGSTNCNVTRIVLITIAEEPE